MNKVFLTLSILVLSFSLKAVRIEHVELIPKKVLTPHGHSADIACDPNTGAIHCIWVTDGRLYYQVMTAERAWNDAVVITPAHHFLYANEFSGPDEWIRFSAGMTIDPDGGMHVVYSTQDGVVYYMDEVYGRWNAPVPLYRDSLAMCHPQVAAFNEYVTVIFEDAHDPSIKPVFAISRINGQWEDAPRVIMQADNPDLICGSNGRVYLTARLFDGEDWKHNIVFGQHIPGFTDWETKQLTHSELSIGKAPSIWVHDERIYIAWSRRLGQLAPTRDYKGPMYCAVSREPGNRWDLHLPSANTDPVYSVATGDPYPRVSAYSDGVIFLTNGKRGWAIHAQTYAFVFDGYWTGNMKCDWEDGIPNLASTGDIVWSLVSTSGPDSQEVSITGFRNTLADPFDFANTRPRLVKMPKTHWLIHETASSRCVVVDEDNDPLTCRLLQGPPGLTLDEHSGTISWTPVAEDSFLLGIKVEDGRGKYDVRYQWIFATDHLVRANFSADPPAGPAPHCVSFQNAVEGTADSLRWDFGDGSQGTEPHPTHCYSEPGIYDVTLTAYRDNQTDTHRIQRYIVVLNPNLNPGFAVSAESGAAPLEVQFSDTSLGQVRQWLWDFGDGQTSVQQHPKHVYTLPGTYTVMLTVTDPYQQKSITKTDGIRVQYARPVPRFSASDTAGFAPLEVRFTDQSTGAITGWAWNFGDGETSSDRQPVHTFQNPGHYSITLVVTGPGGDGTWIRSEWIHVLPVEPIRVDFSADTLAGTAPLTVQFQNLSTGSVVNWAWDFGNGTSLEQHPQHTYTVPGNYSVILTAMGTGISVSMEKNEYIHVTSGSGVASSGALPDQYRLHPNHPNPFNRQTTFRFDLPKSADVKLALFDLRGQRVIELLNACVSAGRHQIAWDGVTATGGEAPSGIYLVRFQAGVHFEQKKVMLLK